MRCLIDIVDNSAKVALEVTGGKGLKVSQGLWGDIALPLQLALALIDNGSELGVLLHVLNEWLGEFQLVSRSGHLSTSEGEVLLVLVRGSILAEDSSLTQVGGKADEIEVLVDVVHDLGLKEGLGGIVHDFVAQLGLSNILSELLDASATGLGWAIFVALPLGSLTVRKLSNQLLDDLKLASEEWVLGHVHLVPVHFEQVKVDTGNSLNQSLVGSSQLELPEEAGGNTASGGPGETDLAVDNDGAVDSRALQGLAHSVKVRLCWGSRVAHRDPHVDKAGVFLLQALDHLGKGEELLNLNLGLLLVDIDVLELAIVALGAALNNSEELLLVLLDRVASDIAKLGILTDLVGGTGTDGVAIHINDGLLSHVEPDDLVGLGVQIAAGLVDGGLKAGHGGLSTAVHLVAGHTAEVGHTIDLLGELLDLFNVISHGGGLPYLRVLSHVESMCFET